MAGTLRMQRAELGHPRWRNEAPALARLPSHPIRAGAGPTPRQATLGVTMISPTGPLIMVTPRPEGVRRMRRLLAVLLLITGVLVAESPPAAARSVDPPPTSGRVYWFALKHEIAMHRITIGPSADTGYGKMVITGMVRKPGTRKYRATYRLYDMRRIVLGTRAPASVFCWPWEHKTVFGCSSWLNPGTWDWSDLFHKAQRATGTSPYPPYTYNRQKKCADGIVGSVFTAKGKSMLANILGKLDYVKITPTSLALGAVVGCTIKLFW
jgi:hypothetical protein